MTGPQVLPKRETQQERKRPCLASLQQELFQRPFGSPRDVIDETRRLTNYERPPHKKSPPKSSTRSLLATRKERRLRKHFGGFENEEFKDSFYLARCSRCREPERRSGCGWRGRGLGEPRPRGCSEDCWYRTTGC